MIEDKNQSLPQGYVLQGEKNRYSIDRVLGQGSFGITYLAKFKSKIQGVMGSGSVQSIVAIKEFFMRDMNVRDTTTGELNDMSEDSLSGKYRRAFIREAHNLASLNHPGIVNVFEVIETNNTVYIVMEYIDGGNLDELISKQGRLPEKEALALFREICSAVDFMHQHHMLHLDIKPKNIMLDDEGHPRLIDFGLSKQYTKDGEPESSTTIGLGTPGYAPIEQAERTDNDNSFRPTIDIYALGATLYKMLTGDTPPKASAISEAALDGENIIAYTLRENGITDSTINLVSKAMWPSCKKRLQNVKDLALDIFVSHNNELTGDETSILCQTKYPTNVVTSVSQPHNNKNEINLKSKSRFLPVWFYPISAILLGLSIFFILHIGDKTPFLLSKQPTIKEGLNNGHEWVDLGLSVKWATCNIGAKEATTYGGFYAWGETNPKDSCAWTNYKFCTSGDFRLNIQLSKYITDYKQGVVDNLNRLEPSDDVAHVRWGSNWRIPTKDEFDELINECEWIWVIGYYYNGYKIISKKRGYTDKYIFLPAAGYIDFNFHQGIGTIGSYWTSDLAPDDTFGAAHAYILHFDSSLAWACTFEVDRYNGNSIRPVCP